jgi:hypothetical protein
LSQWALIPPWGGLADAVLAVGFEGDDRNVPIKFLNVRWGTEMQERIVLSSNKSYALASDSSSGFYAFWINSQDSNLYATGYQFPAGLLYNDIAVLNAPKRVDYAAVGSNGP